MDRTKLQKNTDLAQAIKGIPEIPVAGLKLRYRRGASHIQDSFFLIQQRLIYFDALSLGLRPDDPFDEIDWKGHAQLRTQLELRANLLWAKFQVLNHGFDLIREEAEKEGYLFDFQAPRQLFACILKEQRNHELEPVLSRDRTPTGDGLKVLRAKFKHQNALYRDVFTGQLEEQNFLESCRVTVWSGFWLYAIWKNKLRGGEYSELRNAWKRFLKAHKALKQFWDSYGGGVVQWDRGIPAVSSTKKLATWQTDQLIRIPVRQL